MFQLSTPYERARLAVSLIFAINGFLYANWTSRIPSLQTLYDIGNSQTGMVLLTLSLGSLIAMPLAGYFIVKVGSRRITAAMLLLFICTCPLLALMPSVLALMLAGMLIGMSTGSLDVAMNAQAIVVEEGLGKPIMSSFHAIFSMGMLAGAGTSSLAITLGLGLANHLLLVAVLVLPLAFWCIRQLLPEPAITPSTATETTEQQRKGFRFHPTLFLLGITAFCCMMGEGAMADWTAAYMLRVAQSPEQLAPLGQAAFSGAMMIGRLGGDRARGRYGSLILIRLGAVIALTGLSVALFFPSPLLAFTGFLLVGLGLSNIVPIAYSISGKLPGIPSGVGISSVTTIGYTGFLFGPPLIGFITDYFQGGIERGQTLLWWMGGSWQGLQFGLGFILILFSLLCFIAFFFLDLPSMKK